MCPHGALLFEYDDGNGLWIKSGETPSDQEFFRCACPQDYAESQVLEPRSDESSRACDPAFDRAMSERSDDAPLDLPEIVPESE